MSSQSPATVLYSNDGYELAVVPGAALPVNSRAILIDGSDGTNSHTILTDSSGRQVVVGAGTAGSQTGGVITIQGDPSGTPVPVSGTIAVSSVAGTVAVTQSTSPWVVSGTVTANAGSGTFTVGGTVTSNQGTPNSLANAWPVEVTDGTNVLGTNANPLVITGSVSSSKSTTGTITSVPGSTSSVTLLASNANRVSATIFNDTSSGDVLYVALSASASTTAFTIKLWPGSYWELSTDYTGTISGIWSVGTGNARITELT
jgi:hypothetical protein